MSFVYYIWGNLIIFTIVVTQMIFVLRDNHTRLPTSTNETKFTQVHSIYRSGPIDYFIWLVPKDGQIYRQTFGLFAERQQQQRVKL